MALLSTYVHAAALLGAYAGVASASTVAILGVNPHAASKQPIHSKQQSTTSNHLQQATISVGEATPSQYLQDSRLYLGQK
jgi:hypothetical protein